MSKIETIALSHGGKVYAFTQGPAGEIVCAGCGREFKNFRGRVSHGNARTAADSCKPSVDVSDADLTPTSGVVMVDGQVADKELVAELAAIDAEDYSDARLEAAIGEHFEEVAAAIFTAGEDDEDDEYPFAKGLGFLTNGLAPGIDQPNYVGGYSSVSLSEKPEAEDSDDPVAERNAVIADARRYARVPEFRTTLVHLTGIEEFATPTAWRWHPEDAEALMDTAHSSSVIRVTKHDEGRAGETVITDFHWLDGLRARVTEKFGV